MRAVVIVSVLVAVLGSGCAIQPNDNTLPGQTAVGDDGYTIKVHFDQIENLVPNSTVQKDNVVIGTVGRIDVDGWEAVVDLHLRKDVPLSADVQFSVGQKTLLGAQYVEVTDPRRAATSRAGATPVAVLRDGDIVDVDRTGAHPATEQVLGAVALLLNNGGLSQISTITGELSTALSGRVPDTRSLIRHADELLAVLDSNRGDIVAALQSLDRLSAGLRGDQRRLVDAIDRIGPGLRVLEEERRNLVAAVTGTARVSTRAERVVRTSRSALLANLDSLGPILTNLGRVSESLPEALKLGVTIPWPAMTTRHAIAGDYFNLFTTVDLRSSSLSDAWLAGLLPALQAGDPVVGPLDVPDASPAGSEPSPAAEPDDPLSDLLGLSTETGRHGSDTAEKCLLAVLGLC